MRYRRPGLDVATHVILIIGALIFMLPVLLALMASTHTLPSLLSGGLALLPGSEGLDHYIQLLTQPAGGVAVPTWRLMLNSLIMALGIAVGKLTISIIAAYAIVFFRFRFRMLCFWLIFVTLMLPVEVRIVPTYGVVADLGLLNSYPGLILPLIASATATFLFRQFFLTLPPELLEAARLDGAGPWRFFRDILLPLSKTNMAALFVIMFIYGWNQYLWPLLAASDADYATLVMSLRRLTIAQDGVPPWQLATTMTVLALLPPVAVIVLMQRWFVKGLVDSEK
ncbi:sn-glycerol-3-phosphate ABC transporter permease UgpE [Kushneria aurantia]|uniref:sn-glycerol-3-phosphate transport system permease protein UgpE n=1 Tax=Kushneria aurantia TaxID=504092 RepID=A0ABV6G3L1_9GAMM|nr:sn-glycerol-3-phosphate ABC transporter permease UgpE [Kushneria aurantia]